MNLLLVRHGIAEDEPGAPYQGLGDDYRRLTPLGKEKARKVIKKVLELVPNFSLILTSPLLRAKETGEIFREYSSQLTFEEIPELRPESFPTETLITINQYANLHQNIALVGHQPHISQFATFLLTGDTGQSPLIHFGRATAGLFVFNGNYLSPKKARLDFLIRPKTI